MRVLIIGDVYHTKQLEGILRQEGMTPEFVNSRQLFTAPAQEFRPAGEQTGEWRQERIILPAPDRSSVKFRVWNPDAGGLRGIFRIFEKMVKSHGLIKIELIRPVWKGFLTAPVLC